MPDVRQPVRDDLLGRVKLPRALGHVAIRWPRMLIALLLATIPAAGVLLAALLGPAEFGKAVTETRNVHETFARFLTAVATAGAIAVSVASLAMQREIRGISDHDKRHEANDEYRERVRERLGVETMPVPLAEFLAELLRGISRRADGIRRRAPPEALRARTMDVTLDEHLRAVGERTARSADRLEAARAKPDRLLLELLDQEHELTRSLVRRFARAPDVPEDVRKELRALDDLLCDYVVGGKFAKMLDTQWGLSRMSTAILASTFPSVVTSALMVLTFGEGAVGALGQHGAEALVCAALALALFPLAIFVSYLLRFLVVNQHTLPTDGFVLGPEEKALLERPPEGTAPGRRGA